MRDRFEVLEHKADLKIRVFGKDKKELFLSAMIGMFESAQYEVDEKSKVFKREIKIESIDLPSLLVDFLSEVLYLSETNWKVYHEIQFKKFDDPSTGASTELSRMSSGQVKIEATLIGKKLKRIGVQIKGVTYHNLDIHQREDKTWEATVLFDI